MRWFRRKLTDSNYTGSKRLRNESTGTSTDNRFSDEIWFQISYLKWPEFEFVGRIDFKFFCNRFNRFSAILASRAWNDKAISNWSIAALVRANTHLADKIHPHQKCKYIFIFSLFSSPNDSLLYVYMWFGADWCHNPTHNVNILRKFKNKNRVLRLFLRKKIKEVRVEGMTKYSWLFCFDHVPRSDNLYCENRVVFAATSFDCS